MLLSYLTQQRYNKISYMQNKSTNLQEIKKYSTFAPALVW